MQYTRQGWPKCCGQTMAYFMEAERPAGTRFTHKCPACGSEWAITFPPGVDVPQDPAAVCDRCRAKPTTP